MRICANRGLLLAVIAVGIFLGASGPARATLLQVAPVLDSWAPNAPDRAAVTPINYSLNDSAAQPDGLVRVTVKPRRTDLLLVDGWIFLRPEDGDLGRIEGHAMGVRVGQQQPDRKPDAANVRSGRGTVAPLVSTFPATAANC